MTFLFSGRAYCSGKQIPHLSLLVLEHFIDAGVEGRTREHGGDGVGQVQDCFKYRIHRLLTNQRVYSFLFLVSY